MMMMMSLPCQEKMMIALGRSQGGGGASTLVAGGRSPVTISVSGREPGVLLFGLGTTIPTTVDPRGVVGKCGGAVLVI